MTYIPAVHCCVCWQVTGAHTAATATVMSEHRDYQACDEHAPAIATRGLTAALKSARKGGAV